MSLLLNSLALLAGTASPDQNSEAPTPEQVQQAEAILRKMAHAGLGADADEWSRKRLGNLMRSYGLSGGSFVIEYHRAQAVFNRFGRLNSFSITQGGSDEGTPLPDQEIVGRMERMANALLPPGLQATQIQVSTPPRSPRIAHGHYHICLADHPEFVYGSRFFGQGMDVFRSTGAPLMVNLIPAEPPPVPLDLLTVKLSVDDGWRTALQAYAAISPFEGEANARGGYVYAVPRFQDTPPSPDGVGEARSWATPEHQELARQAIPIPMVQIIVSQGSDFQQLYVDARDGRILAYVRINFMTVGSRPQEPRTRAVGTWGSLGGGSGTLTATTDEPKGVGRPATLRNERNQLLSGLFYPGGGLLRAGQTYRVSPELAKALATEPAPKRPGG